MNGEQDLGIRPTYRRNTDGSQSVNLLEYNRGYGIHSSSSIKVYAEDPDGAEGETVLVAKWDPKN